MSSSLPTTFNPADIEQRWYQHWETTGGFRPERPDAEAFTIVNPPPNVTGSLHIGHALDNTLQDIVVRYERLRGKDALWVVGTDHAGIATQMVVERQLEEKQDKRTNYTREEFVDKVWEWKAESGGTITNQLRRLGCSMDWSREQFTMDPHFTRAVLKVFVDLYNDGLIYRDKRLVNWDPKLKTAISDLEVEQQTIPGNFWHFKYPLADGVTLEDGRDYIEVATTRPETMLADMAVAVHPSDERYASVVGKEVVLPITGRRIPIVEDEHADPELGSGAVKITPGHDFNDFEVGKRAGMAAGEMLNMLDGNADVCQTADGLVPDEFIGLHRFKRDGVPGARELVVERLKELDCLIPHVSKNKKGEEVISDAEPRSIATPFGDRGGVVIEPWLTDQWYVDAETLAQKPIEAVRSGEVEIVPKSWEKTYFNWMENIQPWCVSRQLWWGHRIPAWFGPAMINGHANYDDAVVFVAESWEEAALQAREYYSGYDERIAVADTKTEAINALLDQSRPAEILLYQDEDVLDTWFSSGLWPFATLGWPEDAPTPNPSREREGSETYQAEGAVSRSGVGNGDTPSLLEKHYPNSLLISGFDILFFWDARMLMWGYYNMGQKPWDKLYLHGLVRAADGAKMSKSKGNVVDPLGLIDQYGADALRFFMAAMESQGRDIKMDEKRVEGYRNFATKLWNATRFCQSNGIGASDTLKAPTARLAANQWIIGEVQQVCEEIESAMADLRFDAAANAIYQFTWSKFCDWYLELIKPVLSPLPPAGGAGGGPEASEDSGSAPTPNPSREREGDWSPQSETRAVAGWALDQIFVMLHPFMPFITEELWHAQATYRGGEKRQYDLITAAWPNPRAEVSKEATDAIDWVIDVTTSIRSARSEIGVPTSAKTDLWVSDTKLNFNYSQEEALERQQLIISRLRSQRSALARLARVKMVTVAGTGVQFDLETGADRDFNKPYRSVGNPAVAISAQGDAYSIPLKDLVDIEAEKARLEKALAASEKEAKSLEGRLSNPNFVERAKPEAVAKAREDHAHHAGEVERLKGALARLGKV